MAVVAPAESSPSRSRLRECECTGLVALDIVATTYLLDKTDSLTDKSFVRLA